MGARRRRGAARSPRDPSLLLAAAEIQLGLGNPQLAARFLAAAEPLAPNSADVQIALARAKLAQGDREAARSAAQRASVLTADDPQPADLLIEIDVEHPARLAADRLDAGTRAARRLDPDLARRHWQRASELTANSHPPSARSSASRARLDRPAEALAAYRSAQTAGAKSPELLVAIGRAKRATGDAPGAEQSLREAIKLAPRHGPALTELGALLTDSNRAAEAVPLLQSARDIRKDDPKNNLMLARALRLTGANADALEILATGGSLADVRALREMAQTQQASGDLEGARTTLAKAVALEPDDARCASNCARAMRSPTPWARRASARSRAGSRAARPAAQRLRPRLPPATATSTR